MIRGNIEINRRNKEIIEMIRRNKNNNGIWEKKKKDFMGYITCCTKKNEELSAKIEYIRSRIEMIRLHKEYIRSEIEKILRNEGYIHSKIEKICHNEDQSIDVAFKKMNPSLYLHMYEDITAGMVCIRTVLYTAHGIGQTEIANLKTLVPMMTDTEPRLLRMLLSEPRRLRMVLSEPRRLRMVLSETFLPCMSDPETLVPRMTYPGTRLSEMAYPETHLSGMTDPEACLSGMADPRGSLNKQQTYLNEYLQNNEEKTAKNKYLIYLLMFGNIIWSGLLATSER
ncbi:uncharacterized protein LOC132754893 isoform X2 [Ruditapes philippinarum]|uniref:uncharacterized protein LOC132754893 isoform X2 n=1 Tax=Ruditapes philippinarum TaxID=129788 RepID=UPI00295B4D07|nr:uncharacterized protein LOC132754893 isoform X2 [Ruditapes philippinarum]